MATYANSLPEQNAASSEKAQIPWSAIAWFGALLIACYAPVLFGLVRQWATDEDVGHGFFVPLVAGYIIWKRRGQLAAKKPVPNYWGLALAILGAVLMLLGTLGAQIFVARSAFLVSLVGAVLFLGGTRILKILAFPLFLLLFMIPIPAIIYARITLPLQLFASSVAETVLNFIGIPVLRDGNVLELANQRLSVVEACSGIRSLLSLGFLSLIYAYFFDKKVWMRWVLLPATIPIAIAANASRVTLTGVLSDYRPDLARGAFHLLEGWVLFLVALTLLIAFHQLVNRIYLASGNMPQLDFLKGRAAMILSLCLIVQGSLFYGFSRGETPPSYRALDGFPKQIGGWRMAQQGVMEQEVKDVLRADDYITRDYAASPEKSVNLFVAFFKSQRAGQTPHSPKNCLPGSGWVWTIADTIPVTVPGRAAPMEINRYLVSKGESRSMVLYWYQSRDRVVASEYKAAALVAWDAIRYNRTDTSLVRVVVPVTNGRDDAATQTGVEFIQAFYATLRQFFPA